MEVVRAAIYLRTSADEVYEGTNDLAIQREKCEAMATLKGWEVSSVFIDEGKSGSLDESERPGLAELFDAVQGKEIQAAIVAALDRLATRIDLLLSLVIQITDLGADFVSCNEGLDSSLPTGHYALDIFSALAELEQLTPFSEKTAKTARLSRTGREQLPLGYLRGSHGPEVDIVAARTVRRIFELRSDGYALDEIAAWLDFESISPPTGERWSPSGVKSVLDDEDMYRGGARGEGDEPWPPILSG